MLKQLADISLLSIRSRQFPTLLGRWGRGLWLMETVAVGTSERLCLEWEGLEEVALATESSDWLSERESGLLCAGESLLW